MLRDFHVPCAALRPDLSLSARGPRDDALLALRVFPPGSRLRGRWIAGGESWPVRLLPSSLVPSSVSSLMEWVSDPCFIPSQESGEASERANGNTLLDISSLFVGLGPLLSTHGRPSLSSWTREQVCAALRCQRGEQMGAECTGHRDTSLLPLGPCLPSGHSL